MYTYIYIYYNTGFPIIPLHLPSHWSELAPKAKEGVHPLRQFCTPMDVPLSLSPSFFIPRMLSSPGTLLQRSLKMNDYALSQQLLKHFPTLRGGQVEAAVQIAEHFKELRELLVTRKSAPKASSEDEKVGEEEEQFNKAVETSLQGLQTIPGEESTGSTDLLNSLWLSVANMYNFVIGLIISDLILQKNST